MGLAARGLSQSLDDWTKVEHQRLTQGALALGLAGVLVAAALLVTLRFKVLAPLRRTTEGFQRVAAGDFGHRVPETGTAEVQVLTRSFNRLSARLDLLYRLIEGLQRGQDLDALLALLSRDFRDLLGFDWIGVVFADAARSAARIEASWLDGEHQAAEPRLFRLHGTLLADALGTDAPLHVPDAAARVSASRPPPRVGDALGLGGGNQAPLQARVVAGDPGRAGVLVALQGLDAAQYAHGAPRGGDLRRHLGPRQDAARAGPGPLGEHALEQSHRPPGSRGRW